MQFPSVAVRAITPVGFLALASILAPGNALVTAGDYSDNAWTILLAGTHEKSGEKRALAVATLDLLPDEPKAVKAAEEALQDSNPGVRLAAVTALGDMDARASLPKIKALLETAGGKELMAIAAVLKKFNDPEGYEIYYEILTGTRKAGGGILAGLKDKKNLERMGIEEALGFVPYSGIGIGAYYYLKQNESANNNLLVVSAIALANDPDPATEKALIQASYDAKDPVKVAALRALAKRGDPAALKEIEPAMHSEKSIVSYTAAAAVVRLSNVPHYRRPTEANARKR